MAVTNGGHQWRSDPNIEAFQDHGGSISCALTRGDTGGSKQTRTADSLLVRQVL